MCRYGLRSSPGNLCEGAEILGLLRSPSRHKAAPTGGRGKASEALQNQLTYSAGQPRLARLPRPAVGAGVCAVNQATLASAALAGLASSPGLARCAAVQADHDAFLREALRHAQADAPTRRAIVPVAAVIAVGTAAGLAPGAATGLAVGAIQPHVPRRTGTATGIDGQALGIHFSQFQVQAAA